MMDNYYEAREWLESFIPLVYGKSELGLGRIENLLKLLGNPQKKFKSVLVAGTSGKGSTAFYIARLLQYSKSEIRNPKSETNDKNSNFQNYKNKKVSSFEFRVSSLKPTKVGLHISPHLVDVRERMQIFSSPVILNESEGSRDSSSSTQNDNSLIPMNRFIALVNEIKPVIDAIGVSQPELLPSYFEILVALSFLYFAVEKVDWAVVEVGLGGRLDATNVLIPEISVITNIGLDHTEILGKTIEKIAKEKAGIIKENVPIVTGARGKALKVIEKVVKEKNALLINLNTLSKNNRPKTDIDRYISRYYYLFRSTDDSFASQNKNLALLSVLSLGIKPDAQGVKRACSGGFLGRLEEIDRGVVLDGAHNTDKIKALIEFVRKLQITNHQLQIVLVIGFKQGKDWKEMIDLLMKNLPINKIIATEYQSVADTGFGSAVEAEEIANYLTKDKRLTTKAIKNSQEAVFEGLMAKGEMANGILLVTGSLYLVGEVRTLWKLPEF